MTDSPATDECRTCRMTFKIMEPPKNSNGKGLHRIMCENPRCGRPHWITKQFNRFLYGMSPGQYARWVGR